MRVIIGISEVIVGILLFIGVKKWAGKWGRIIRKSLRYSQSRKKGGEYLLDLI